jgi:hypothetical protein
MLAGGHFVGLTLSAAGMYFTRTCRLRFRSMSSGKTDEESEVGEGLFPSCEVGGGMEGVGWVRPTIIDT